MWLRMLKAFEWYMTSKIRPMIQSLLGAIKKHSILNLNSRCINGKAHTKYVESCKLLLKAMYQSFECCLYVKNKQKQQQNNNNRMRR